MHNYGFYLENAWGKPRTGEPHQAGEATVTPRDEQSEGVWKIDKKYSDLETLYARRRLTGLTWHVDGQEVFVPLSSAGEVGSNEPFVFSVALPADDGSNYSYFHTFTLEFDETFTYIKVKIAGGVETAFQVVDLAPDGKPDVSDPSTQLIYLTREPDSSATDPYTEWIYTADGQWEIIGETSIDLSGYYTSAQVDEKISEVSGEASEAIGELREAKADKVESAVDGNFAGLDGNGNLTDSGSKASDFKTKQATVTVSGLGTAKTITSLTQNANGEISASASDIRTASTLQTGIVQLNDSIDSTSTSQAATANAVKKACDHTDALVAGLDAEVTSDDGTNVQVKVTQVDGIVTGVNITKDTSANAESVAQALAALDAEVTSSDGTNVQVRVTEVDGKVTAVNVTDDTVNSADVDTAITSAIGDLDVSDLVQDSSGSMAGKTLLTLNESDGKIGATFQDIAITSSQISDLTNTYTGTGTTAITDKSVKAAIDDLNVSEIGGAGKVITTISETAGKISATAVDYTDIVPAPDADDTLFTGSSDGTTDWQPLVKSAWGTVITDGENNLVDENGNAIMDENEVDLWTTFKGVGFGAERAAADVEGNLITETYATKSEVSEAIADAHTHSNKAVLDATTASYTTEEQTKLSGIESGAQVNVPEMESSEVANIVNQCEMPDYVPKI